MYFLLQNREEWDIINSIINKNSGGLSKDTIIGNVLDIAPEAAPMFLSIGMHCLGCPSSRGETVEEACMVHGVDADEFLDALNAFLGEAAE